MNTYRAQPNIIEILLIFWVSDIKLDFRSWVTLGWQSSWFCWAHSTLLHIVPGSQEQYIYFTDNKRERLHHCPAQWDGSISPVNQPPDQCFTVLPVCMCFCSWSKQGSEKQIKKFLKRKKERRRTDKNELYLIFNFKVLKSHWEMMTIFVRWWREKVIYDTIFLILPHSAF